MAKNKKGLIMYDKADRVAVMNDEYTWNEKDKGVCIDFGAAGNIPVSSLVTVHNYAKRINRTVSMVYKLVAQNKVDSVLIDGMRFIVLSHK